MDDGTVITRCFILSANGTATIDINRPICQDNNSFSPPPSWEIAVQGVHLVQKKQNTTFLHSLGAPLILSCSNAYYMDKSSMGSLEKHLHPLMLVDIDGLPPGAGKRGKPGSLLLQPELFNWFPCNLYEGRNILQVSCTFPTTTSPVDHPTIEEIHKKVVTTVWLIFKQRAAK